MKTRRQLLTALGVGAAAGIAGCSSDTENNTTRSETTTGTADTQEQTETPEKQNTETTEQEPDDEQTTDLAPVDAPFYDSSVKNADIQDFHSDTEELRDAAQQGGHTGAVQIGRLFQGQTDADSAYAAAQILHTDPDLATDYIIDTIPGQINASDQDYIFIQPVQNGQPLEPVIAGQAYNGFEVYNPENPEAASTSMQRLVDDGDSELSFSHDMESIQQSIELIENDSGATEEQRQEATEGTRELYFDKWPISMLGVTAEDDLKLRPVDSEDGTFWKDSRFDDIEYEAIAGEVQHQYMDSQYHGNNQWTGYEVVENGANFDIEFTNDVEVDDPL